MSESSGTSLSTPTSTKQVRWKLAAEEYSVFDTPESRTVALPSPQPSPTAPTSPDPLRALSLSPTPRPMDELPLPHALQLHTALTPAHALQLDFSFPSAAFRCNPQLTPDILSAYACTPPQTTLFVRITLEPGLYAAKLEIRHDNDGDVTVGDVLTTIQKHLRQPDDLPPLGTETYTARRILTVNGFCVGRSAETQATHIAAEREGGAKVVDRLLGHTLFAGLTPLPGKPDNYFQLELRVPPRYSEL